MLSSVTCLVVSLITMIGLQPPLPVSGQAPAPVRLVSNQGTSPSANNTGRLEIFLNGEWGTVCDDFFDGNDATVACRQLGFDGYTAYGSVRNLGYAEASSSTPIWLDDLSCTSSDTAIESCIHNGIGVENCGHSEDIALECFRFDRSLYGCNVTGAVRLVGGTYEFEGRVEVCYNDLWGTIAPRYDDSGWSNDESRVLCEQLLREAGDFEEPSWVITRQRRSNKPSAYFGPGNSSQPVHFGRVRCTGNETTLQSCSKNSLSGLGPHRDDIGVTCIPANTSVLPACEPGQFQCQNGYCLNTPPSSNSSSRLCDLANDCGDCSDECHCNNTDSRYYSGPEDSCRLSSLPNSCNCSSDEFQCSNGYCTPMLAECDGDNDCGDNSDELTQECNEIREQRAREADKEARRELGIALGVSIGGAALIVSLWLIMFGLCMVIPFCPLKKAYFSKFPPTPAEASSTQ